VQAEQFAEVSLPRRGELSEEVFPKARPNERALRASVPAGARCPQRAGPDRGPDRIGGKLRDIFTFVMERVSRGQHVPLRSGRLKRGARVHRFVPPKPAPPEDRLLEAMNGSVD